MPSHFPKNNLSVVRNFLLSFITISKAIRVLSVLIIFAFLLPAIFVGNFSIVKAEKQISANTLPLPITAPPLPFSVSKPDSAFSGLAINLSYSISEVSRLVHKTSETGRIGIGKCSQSGDGIFSFDRQQIDFGIRFIFN